MKPTLNAPEAQQASLTAADGTPLALYDWTLPPTERRGTVLMVHGLGEHMGRYAHVAQQLNGWGFAACGYDHYGHGRSGGPRGGLDHDQRLLSDLAQVIDATRLRLQPGEPLVLLGHSLGGLVAATAVAQGLRPVDGLVLSSPALATDLSWLQKLLLGIVPALAPQLRVGNGLDVQALSHDSAVVAAYQADPLCHDRISARLGRFIAQAGPSTLAQARSWSVPTLLMWAGADRLVRPAGSTAFAAAAPAAWVQAQCFDGLYHELFNETPERAAPVFERLQAWLVPGSEH